MAALRMTDGSVRLRMLRLCAMVCLLVTGSHAFEASGQGESTYEEYDDEGPYHREFEVPDGSDDGLEDFGDHQYDVLDPITDDDISYSGYYDEVLDTVSTVPAHEGNVNSIGFDSNVPVVDDRHTPEPSVIGVREPVSPVNEATVDPFTQRPFETHEAAGTGFTTDDNVTASVSTDAAQTTTIAFEDTSSCIGHRKLAEQPVFVDTSMNLIRKCCHDGERLVRERSILFSCQKESMFTASEEQPSTELYDYHRNDTGLSAIVAQFYDGCIEDLEKDIKLGFSYGNPCSIERGLVSFGARSNDTLYVIQNGSLLVIYGVVKDYDIFDTYCLDYDQHDGTLVGYVCPEEVEIRMDIIAGQLFALKLCLIFAIPLLLLTAAFYMIIPELHDLHGRALAMNCVNFAIALLLESFFQHKTRGKRMNSDEMVLENYAEYFILATFFWLLANCANNCFHAWVYVPQSKEVTERWENRRFVAYAAVAQLIPLWIILSCSTTADGRPAIKYYFFRTIMLILLLTLICLIICFAGLRKVKNIYFFYHEVRQRVIEKGDEFNEDDIGYIKMIPAKRVNKVIYMANYTALLFVVMAVVWTIMTTTYYATYELPIFYDILFGLQGILMFIIFVCMRKPFCAVRHWFKENNYCCCYVEPGERPADANGTAVVQIMQRGVPETKPPVDCETRTNRAEFTLVETGVPKRDRYTNPFKYIPE